MESGESMSSFPDLEIPDLDNKENQIVMNSPALSMASDALSLELSESPNPKMELAFSPASDDVFLEPDESSNQKMELDSSETEPKLKPSIEYFSKYHALSSESSDSEPEHYFPSSDDEDKIPKYSGVVSTVTYLSLRLRKMSIHGGYRSTDEIPIKRKYELASSEDEDSRCKKESKHSSCNNCFRTKRHRSYSYSTPPRKLPPSEKYESCNCHRSTKDDTYRVKPRRDRRIRNESFDRSTKDNKCRVDPRREISESFDYYLAREAKRIRHERRHSKSIQDLNDSSHLSEFKKCLKNGYNLVTKIDTNMERSNFYGRDLTRLAFCKKGASSRLKDKYFAESNKFRNNIKIEPADKNFGKVDCKSKEMQFRKDESSGRFKDKNWAESNKLRNNIKIEPADKNFDKVDCKSKELNCPEPKKRNLECIELDEHEDIKNIIVRPFEVIQRNLPSTPRKKLKFKK